MMGSAVKAAEAKFVSAFRAEFESAAEARKRPKALAGAMVDKDHDTIPGVSKKGEILTLTTEKALEHGYCDYVVSDISSALRRLNFEKASVERVKPTSAEWLARYLTNPNISVVLFTIGFWCLIIEFFIAGFGFFGWLGLTCLALFFGGHLFAYLAGLESLILFTIGVVLLLLEIFVVPGFGITGISGILCVSFSIIMTFGGIYSAVHAVAKIITLSAGLLTALYLWGPKLKLFDKFVLNNNMTTENGFVAVDSSGYEHLAGLEGVAVSPCRPSGKAKIGDERYDVISDGEFIEKGARVTVRKVDGTKITVRQLSD
jgi:membrane-bound serine protease (ClpP class)